MSLLVLDAVPGGVTALLVGVDGTVTAEVHRSFDRYVPAPGQVEHAPEEIWRAALAATTAVLDGVDQGALRGVGVTNRDGSLVLWDRETLGAARPAVAGSDRRADATCVTLRAGGHAERVRRLSGRELDGGLVGPRLAWLAEHEPRTWALVDSGQYAVGTVESYLVARMTRGTWHVTDVANASRTLLLDLAAGAWSAELCALHGVPPDALPELVPSWGVLDRTDPRSFCGLELPIAGIACHRAAVLFGQTCFDAGEAAFSTDGGALVTGSRPAPPGAGLSATAVWRSPGGVTTYALAGPAPGGPAGPPALAGLVGLARLGLDEGVDERACQDWADRLGVPVERGPVVPPALGAAFLAGIGTGVWASTEELRGLRPVPRRFEPTR